jgi:hypothetical protein
MRNFEISEFQCKCCGEVKMEAAFLEALDNARGVADMPFRINSGYRCPKYNVDVGSKKTSPHPKGYAADIACPHSRPRFLIIEALLQAGITRIGIDKDFIYADGDPEKAPEVIWTY